MLHVELLLPPQFGNSGMPVHWASTLLSRSAWLHLRRRGWAAGQKDQFPWAQVQALWRAL